MSIVLMLSLFACSSSNDVVSNRLIQKRKYQKVFHLNGLAHKKNIKSELETGEVAELNEPKSLNKLQSDRKDYPSVHNQNELSDIDRLPNPILKAKQNKKSISKFELMKLAIRPKQLLKNVPSIPESWYDGIEPDKEQEKSNEGFASLLCGLLAFAIPFITLILGLVIPFVFLFGLIAGFVLAIVAIAKGAESRKYDDAAKAGFILGWIFLSLTILFVILFILFILLLIAAFSSY